MGSLTTTRVRESSLLGAGQTRVVLEPPEGFLDAHERAGQYCVLGVPGGEAAPYALMSTPAERSLAFLIGDQGDPGETLASLSRGDDVEVGRPSGPGFDLAACEKRDLVFVATGTGIAPIRAALTVALERRVEVGSLSLYYGLKSRRYVAVESELTAWINAGVRVRFHFSETDDGYVQDVVIADAPDTERAAFVVAGHPEVSASLRQWAGDDGLVLENL